MGVEAIRTMASMKRQYTSAEKQDLKVVPSEEFIATIRFVEIKFRLYFHFVEFSTFVF